MPTVRFWEGCSPHDPPPLAGLWQGLDKVFGAEFSDTLQGVKVLGAIQKLLGKLLEKLLNSPVVKVSLKVSEAEFSEAPKGGVNPIKIMPLR